MSEVSWIDDEGNARIWHDDNYQMVTFTSPCDVELKMDSWDMAFACNMIVFGDGMDRMSLIEYGLTQCPHGTHGNDRAHHSLTCINRFSTLTGAAIAIGILKEHNTPANWIKWAKGKNYNTDHLNPAVQIASLQIALQECPDDCPSVRAGYREQLEQWQAIADTQGHPHNTLSIDTTPEPLPDSKPWLIPDPKDPRPDGFQDWYTPARYFARQRVIGDSNLLTNKDKLESEVVLSLNNAGIKTARKGKFSRNGTIKKAWVNVDLG